MNEKDAGERYGTRETSSGDIVIYDAENDDAWIRSDTAMNLTRQA